MTAHLVSNHEAAEMMEQAAWQLDRKTLQCHNWQPPLWSKRSTVPRHIFSLVLWFLTKYPVTFVQCHSIAASALPHQPTFSHCLTRWYSLKESWAALDRWSLVLLSLSTASVSKSCGEGHVSNRIFTHARTHVVSTGHTNTNTCSHTHTFSQAYCAHMCTHTCTGPYK